MKIITDEKIMCCKENKKKFKASHVSVERTVEGYLPQRFYKGFFVVGFFEVSFLRGEWRREVFCCYILLCLFRLFLNSGS